MCRVKFAVPPAGRAAVASLYPTAEEARITCAIVDAAAKVRDLNFKYLAEGKGATVTPASAPMVWPSAIRTARMKARTMCFSGFNWSRFDLLFAPSSHYQELTP